MSWTGLLSLTGTATLMRLMSKACCSLTLVLVVATAAHGLGNKTAVVVGTIVVVIVVGTILYIYSILTQVSGLYYYWASTATVGL